MKRLITLTVALSLLFSLTHAQLLGSGESDNAAMVNKNGYTILPEKGDIGFCIDATPFADFVGNLIKINSGGAFNSNLHIQHPEGGTMFCIKYFTSDKTAVRAKFRIAYTGEITKYEVVDDATTDPNADLLVDKVTESYINFDIGLGIEKRRGSSRLQGIYGAEAMLTFERGNDGTPNISVKYANEMSASNPNPTSSIATLPVAPNGGRYLKIKQNPWYGLGGRAFLGAEYFFTPKIAIGGELGIALLIEKEGQSKEKYEWMDAGSYTEEVEKSKDLTGTEFMLDNEYDMHLYLILCF